MSIKKMPNNTFLLEEDLLICDTHGLVSFDPNDDPETRQRWIKVTMTLPGSFFDPVPVTVDFPPELMADKVVSGQVNQIDIPIVAGARKGNVRMEETLKDGRGQGVIAILMKKIFGEHDEYKK